MEEDHYNPYEIISIDVNRMLHAGVLYMNKKRKLQEEHLGLPLPKHNCLDRSLTSELGSQSNAIIPEGDLCEFIINEKVHGGSRDDESEQESTNDSNSFAGDTDSIMSISGEAKTDLQYLKASSVDCPATSSSVNWDGVCFKGSLYSLDSRSMTKSSVDVEKSQHHDGVHNPPHQDFVSPTSLNYEQLLEFANKVDYSCSEFGEGAVEQFTDKELQDFLCSSGGNQDNFVLSSGRWTVNQENQQGAEKLTIDKEFEQYFSNLML